MLRQHIYSKTIGSQKRKSQPRDSASTAVTAGAPIAKTHSISKVASRTTFYNPLSESRLTALMALRASEADVLVKSPQSNAQQNMGLYNSVVGTSKFQLSRVMSGSFEDDMKMGSLNASQTKLSLKDILQPSSPLELLKLVQPLLNTSNSAKSASQNNCN